LQNWRKCWSIISFFRQIRYFPLEKQTPNLILELEGAIADCRYDVQRMHNEYRIGCKCWITVEVHYEPVNPREDKHKKFDKYLSAPATRIFKIDGVVNGWVNPYEESLQRLSERINDYNSKFIRDKSGFKQSRINQLILIMSLYDPISARAWKPLPKFLANKKQLLI
jgi:hypothetical protein